MASPEQPGALGPGFGQALLALGLGLGLDLARAGCFGGLAAGVGAALSHQLLFAAGQLDLAGQLVLRDRAFAFDGDRAPFVGGLVGLLLKLLAGRGLQGLLHVRLRLERDHAGADHRDAGLGQPGVLDQPAQDPVPDLAQPVTQQVEQRAGRDQAEHLLLRGLRQQSGELLKRGAAPAAGRLVNREIQPG